MSVCHFIFLYLVCVRSGAGNFQTTEYDWLTTSWARVRLFAWSIRIEAPPRIRNHGEIVLIWRLNGVALPHILFTHALCAGILLHTACNKNAKLPHVMITDLVTGWSNFYTKPYHQGLLHDAPGIPRWEFTRRFPVLDCHEQIHLARVSSVVVLFACLNLQMTDFANFLFC